MEPAQLTVQLALRVGEALFKIINVFPAVVKFAGDVPHPSLFIPQVATKFKAPADFE